MEDTKNKIGVILLVIILLLFSVGGFFFMNYMVNETDKPHDKKNSENESEVRIDTTKDFIYFENSEELIHEVFKEDVVINFLGFESINQTLHQELETLSANKVLAADAGVTCDEDVYTVSYREYEYNQFGNYISLNIINYDYNCEKGSIPTSMKSYVIDKNTGKQIDNETLLKTFDVTESKILDLVKKRLDFSQTLDEDESQVIDVDGTVNSFNDGKYNVNKSLSISKNGKLTINYIVKSNKINYNDSIEID